MSSRSKSKSHHKGERTTRQHHPDAAGIDVGGASHYVAVPADRDPLPVRSFGAFTEDLFALADWLTACRITTVAMEATGGYEKLPFALVWAVGIPAVILNPRAVRRFAEAMGFLEKTDRLDAGIIEIFFAHMIPDLYTQMSRAMAEV